MSSGKQTGTRSPTLKSIVLFLLSVGHSGGRVVTVTTKVGAARLLLLLRTRTESSRRTKPDFKSAFFVARRRAPSRVPGSGGAWYGLQNRAQATKAAAVLSSACGRCRKFGLFLARKSHSVRSISPRPERRPGLPRSHTPQEEAGPPLPLAKENGKPVPTNAARARSPRQPSRVRLLWHRSVARGRSLSSP
jgi:hypothetical protein